MVLDASVLIDELRSSQPEADYLAGLTDPALLLGDLSRIEVMQGLRRSAQRQAAEKLSRSDRLVTE